ncbi:MAG: methyltransferase domain-containing protein [Deltaproteobacteria bacterium]|nr:methyltransferase domain-containing protein [Deltaproteobacteria bacterium]
MIEKSAIIKSFGRAARTYDGYATLQREAAGVVASLLTRFMRGAVPVTIESGMAAGAHSIRPLNVLDAGSGTGALSTLIKDDGWRVFGLDIALPMLKCARASLAWTGKRLSAGDLEALPYKDASFDAVASSLALQWSAPELSFAEASRVLRPGGLFVFSTLGPATLHEIRECLGTDAPARLTSKDEALCLLAASGFETIFSEEKTVVKSYPTLRGLLVTLKHIGASPASKDGKGPGSTLLKDAEEEYARSFAADGGGVRATYELIYIAARRKV